MESLGLNYFYYINVISIAEFFLPSYLRENSVNKNGLYKGRKNFS